jgi:hypothetical protein
MRASASSRQSPPATSAAAGREAGRAVASSASVAQLGQGERVLAVLQQRHRRSHHVRELPHIPRPPQQGKGGHHVVGHPQRPRWRLGLQQFGDQRGEVAAFEPRRRPSRVAELAAGRVHAGAQWPLVAVAAAGAGPDLGPCRGGGSAAAAADGAGLQAHRAIARQAAARAGALQPGGQGIGGLADHGHPGRAAVGPHVGRQPDRAMGQGLDEPAAQRGFVRHGLVEDREARLADDQALLREAQRPRPVQRVVQVGELLLPVHGLRALGQGMHGLAALGVPAADDFHAPGQQAHLRVGPVAAFAAEAEARAAQLGGQAGLGLGRVGGAERALALAGEAAQRVGVKAGRQHQLAAQPLYGGLEGRGLAMLGQQRKAAAGGDAVGAHGVPLMGWPGIAVRWR